MKRRNHVLRSLGILVAFTLGGLSAQSAVFQVSNNQNVGTDFDLDPGNTYTHKLDFPGDGSSETINGVQFSPVAENSGTDPLTGNGYSLLGTTNTFTGTPNEMISDFRFGRNNTLTLDDLTPGQVYDTRLYYRDFGSRLNNVTVDTGSGDRWVGTLDQTPGFNENYISILHEADSSTTTLTFAGHGAGNWHHYGVTNQTASAPAMGAMHNISGLYPTGVDDNGIALASGVADPHYTVSGPLDPGLGGQAMVMTNFGAWDINDGGSMWIGVNNNGGTQIGDEYAGTYLYELVFNLPADADLSTVQISGDWWGDNANPTIFLNGTSTGVTGGAHFQGQDLSAATADGSPFSIAHGLGGALFLHGANTIGFSVPEPPGVTFHGFRTANLLGTYNTAIPEPSTVILAGLGLMGMCLRRHRRD